MELVLSVVILHAASSEVVDFNAFTLDRILRYGRAFKTKGGAQGKVRTTST